MILNKFEDKHNQDYFIINDQSLLADEIPAIRKGFGLGVPEISSTPAILDEHHKGKRKGKIDLKKSFKKRRRSKQTNRTCYVSFKTNSQATVRGRTLLLSVNCFKPNMKNFSKPSHADKDKLDKAHIFAEDIYLTENPGRGERQVKLAVSLNSLIRGFNKLKKAHGDWQSSRSGYMKKSRKIQFSRSFC